MNLAANFQKIFLYNIYLASCEHLNYQDCADTNICCTLNTELHRRLRRMLPKQYRMVLQVLVTEKSEQDVIIASKWLWNELYDSHVTETFETPTLTVTVVYHCIYLE